MKNQGVKKAGNWQMAGIGKTPKEKSAILG
jgi:hypothetical protein